MMRIPMRVYDLGITGLGHGVGFRGQAWGHGAGTWGGLRGLSMVDFSSRAPSLNVDLFSRIPV